MLLDHVFISQYDDKQAFAYLSPETNRLQKPNLKSEICNLNLEINRFWNKEETTFEIVCNFCLLFKRVNVCHWSCDSCRDDRMFLLSLNHKMLSESSQIMPESLFVRFYTHTCGVKFIVDFSILPFYHYECKSYDHTICNEVFSIISVRHLEY